MNDDLHSAVDHLNSWLDLEFELNRVHMDPKEQAQPDRVVAELSAFIAPSTLDLASVQPFKPHQANFEPALVEQDNADSLERLRRRVLFKAEFWSAPAVGGLVKCMISDSQGAWTIKPEFVFDLAQIEGEWRVLAIHDPCSKCTASGLVASGEACTKVDGYGNHCENGLLLRGGFAVAPGELIDRVRLKNPYENADGTPFSPKPFSKWQSYMAR